MNNPIPPSGQQGQVPVVNPQPRVQQGNQAVAQQAVAPQAAALQPAAQLPFAFGNNMLLRPMSGTALLNWLTNLQNNRVQLSNLENQTLTNLTNRMQALRNLEQRVAQLPQNEQAQHQQGLTDARRALDMEGNRIADRFNNYLTPIPQANRSNIQPNGIHIPQGANIPNAVLQRHPNLIQNLQGPNGQTVLQNLPQADRDAVIQAITVNLQNNDIMPIPANRERDFFASFNPDGRVFPYTFCPPHALSNLRVPTLIQTRDQGNVQQNVNPSSLRVCYYRLPNGQLTQGHYFEVTESAGPNGNGGVNGVVLPLNQPLVIINNHNRGNTGNRAYIVNPSN